MKTPEANNTEGPDRDGIGDRQPILEQELVSVPNSQPNSHEDEDVPEIVELPIDGVLDLHTFSPADVKDLVPAYIEECVSRDILQIRIIHGKGTGTLRRIVRSILDTNPHVVRYWQEEGTGGGWGATVVALASRP